MVPLFRLGRLLAGRGGRSQGCKCACSRKPKVEAACEAACETAREAPLCASRDAPPGASPDASSGAPPDPHPNADAPARHSQVVTAASELAAAADASGAAGHAACDSHQVRAAA